MEESIFMDGVRAFFAMLDRMAYFLITVFYNTISDLASAQLVQSSVINEITSRIYALLSVFMIFRISFSLINYIVDPNQVTDKAKGGGALIKNVVITFALIVSVPFGFNLLYEAQSAILADQLIPRFLLGVEINQSPNGSADGTGGGYKLKMTGCDNELTIPNMGNYIGLAIFKPFFVPQDEAAAGDNEVGSISGEAWDLYCYAGEKLGESSVKNMLSDDDLYNSPKGWSVDNYYTMDYSFGLSTAIGIVVALILLGYCFDIATRAFKLLFLEIIAPIPIISYIDPNSSKSGMFIKWLKEVGGTWISLFTRLASLFLAIFVIQQITATDGMLYFVDGYQFNGYIAWIKILIIIGALMFAKQLPKILENILGFQLGGNMTLNPFKKLEGEALGFKQISSGARTGATMAVGAAAGAVGGGLSNAWAAHVNNTKAFKTLADKEGLTEKKWSDLSFAQKSAYRKDYKAAGGRSGFGNVGSILAGAGSAGVRSAAAGAKSKKFSPFKSAEAGITGSSTARTRRAAGYGIGAQIMDKATDMAHIPQSYGTTSILKNEKKAQEQKMNELIARNEALRDQSAYLKAQNPNSSLAYNEAGKVDWVEDGNGKTKREYHYKTYDDYEKDFLDKLANAEGDDLERLNAIGVLSRDEFERARAFDDEIQANKEAIDAAKKEISKIDENMKKDSK